MVVRVYTRYIIRYGRMEIFLREKSEQEDEGRRKTEEKDRVEGERTLFSVAVGQERRRL